MASIEADEAFARRLQAQELGVFTAPEHADAQTPLMRDRANAAANNTNPNNPTVINARLTEISSSWTTVVIILLANIPQILAGMIVLALHWETDHTCNETNMTRWRWWALMSILRMMAYSAIIFYIQFRRGYLQTNNETLIKAVSIRNTLEAFALVWFVVGNMWLFGDDDHSCSAQANSPIYNLCFSYLVIMYLQICAPCIVAILLIPVFCFCLPCFIRILARLHDPRRTEGAPQNIIDTIPVVTIAEEHMANGQTVVCPICLNEMVLGESARQLRCQHLFHQECVDEWLRVNATCPTCRKTIREVAEDPANAQGAPHDAGHTAAQSTTATVGGTDTLNPMATGTGSSAGAGTGGSSSVFNYEML